MKTRCKFRRSHIDCRLPCAGYGGTARFCGSNLYDCAHDFAKHFIVSALIAVYAEDVLLGRSRTYKEIEHLFNDIAADRGYQIRRRPSLDSFRA